MENDWKKRLGTVYSTNPDFKFETEGDETQETLPPNQQNLRVELDKKQRKGKAVTLITGFVGIEDEKLTEEEWIKRIAPTLTQVIKQNPYLIDNNEI